MPIFLLLTVRLEKQGLKISKRLIIKGSSTAGNLLYKVSISLLLSGFKILVSFSISVMEDLNLLVPDLILTERS